MCQFYQTGIKLSLCLSVLFHQMLMKKSPMLSTMDLIDMFSNK